MTNIEDSSAEHAAHSSGDVRANSGGAFANLTHLPHLPHLTGKDPLGSDLHPTSSNAPPEPATVDEPLIDSSAAAPAEPDVYGDALRRIGWADPQPEPPASDEPARCEHGASEAHPLRCDKICDAAAGGSCFTPWCRCQCHHGPCPGPAASGTPDGGL